MSEPQPEMRRALELALGEPVAPYGLKGRVRRALDQRMARASTARVRVHHAFVVALALGLGVLSGLRLRSSHGDVAPKSSVLSLRSARALLRPDTELAVERDDERGAALRLVSGVVLIHVQKGTGRSFSVVAGATRVEVVGTIFGVSRGKDGGAAVEVVEGVVQVTDPSGAHRLGAGERWPAGAALFDDSSELALVRAPVNSTPIEATRDSAVAPSAVLATPVEASVSATQEHGTAPDHAAPPAHAPEAPNARNVRASRDASSGEQSAYAQAKNLEHAGNHSAAIVAYEALSARGGRLAEDALFSVLRLRAAQTERAAALAAVEQYRARFPSGRYARDVDVQRLNLDTANGDAAAALRESEAFLQQFPNDPRAFRFRLVRAAARAARGDCASALADLERVPASDAKNSVSQACAKH